LLHELLESHYGCILPSLGSEAVVSLVANQPYYSEVNSQYLKHEPNDEELDTDATWATALDQLTASHCVTALLCLLDTACSEVDGRSVSFSLEEAQRTGSRNLRIIPNISNCIVSKKDSVKQGEIL
jgi:hypothetical protein